MSCTSVLPEDAWSAPEALSELGHLIIVTLGVRFAKIAYRRLVLLGAHLGLQALLVDITIYLDNLCSFG